MAHNSMECVGLILCLALRLCTAYTYDPQNGLPLGIYGPMTSVSQEFLVAAVAFDIDLRKNFEPALRAKYGDPIVKLSSPHPDLKEIKTVIGTSHSESVYGMRTAMDWFLGAGGASPIVGLVGGYHSAISMPIASAGTVFKMPQVAWGSTSPALSNKGQYPYFLRTIPPDSIQGAAMWGWVKHFDVPTVSFVYMLEAYGEGLFQAFSENAARAKETNRVTGHGMAYFPGQVNYDLEMNRKRIISVRDTGDRFIIMAAVTDQVGPLLKLFDDEGMLYSGNYQFLGSEAVYMSPGIKPSKSFPIGFHRFQPKTMGTLFPKFKELWKKIKADDVYGADAVTRYRLDLMKVRPKDELKAKMVTDQSIVKIAEEGFQLELPFLFDAAYCYVTAIDQMLKDGKAKKDIHGDALHEQLMKTSFEGISGTVSFNKLGDRLAAYELYNTLVDDTVKFTYIGEFDAAKGTLNTKQLPVWTDGKTGKWPPEALLACGNGAGWNAQSSLCAPCSAGQFSPGGFKVQCERCPAGHRSNKPEGADGCVACKKGNYTNDGKKCYHCQKGTFSDKDGADECTMCPKGKFAKQAGSFTCDNCSGVLTESTTEVIGATASEQCICPAAKFRRTDSGTCTECPVGMTCTVGSDMSDYAKNEGTYPLLQPGFWSDPSASLAVYRCANDVRCPGGEPGSCLSGSKGRSCAVCDMGWASDGEKCMKCSYMETTRILFPVLPVLLAPVVISFLYFFFRDMPERWSSWQNSCAALAFLMLNHYQMVSIMGGANVQMPPVMEKTWKIWSMSEDVISLFNPSCTGLGGFREAFIMRALLPVFLALLVLLTLAGNRILAAMLNKPAIAMDVDRTFNVFFSIIFAFFVGLASMSMSLFKAQSNPSADPTLAKDLSIVYHSDDWMSMLWLAILCILIYTVGCVLLFGYTIFVAPKRFHEEAFQKRWKFLFIKFRSSIYWWSLVILSKGVVLNMATACIAEAAGQLYWMIVFTLVYMCAVATFFPWRSRVANYMDLAVHASIVVLAALLVPFADLTPQTRHELAIFTVIMSCMPALSLVCTGFFVLRPVYERNINCAVVEAKLQQQCSLIKDTGDVIASLPQEDVKTMMAHLGEWDRDMLTSACQAISVEFGFQKGRRLTDQKLYETGSKAMEFQRNRQEESSQCPTLLAQGAADKKPVENPVVETSETPTETLIRIGEPVALRECTADSI